MTTSIAEILQLTIKNVNNLLLHKLFIIPKNINVLVTIHYLPIF